MRAGLINGWSYAFTLDIRSTLRPGWRGHYATVSRAQPACSEGPGSAAWEQKALGLAWEIKKEASDTPPHKCKRVIWLGYGPRWIRMEPDRRVLCCSSQSRGMVLRVHSHLFAGKKLKWFSLAFTSISPNCATRKMKTNLKKRNVRSNQFIYLRSMIIIALTILGCGEIRFSRVCILGFFKQEKNGEVRKPIDVE